MTRPYVDVAYELRRIADDLEHAVGGTQPQPMTVWLTFSPEWRQKSDRDEAAEKAEVDRIAATLGAAPGAAECQSGLWSHRARVDYGRVHVRAWCDIADPTERDKDAEIERLHRELAALREVAATPATKPGHSATRQLPELLAQTFDDGPVA